MKKLTFFDKILFVINSIAATLLLLSIFVPHISTRTIPIFAVLSLFVPFILIINLAFLVYWILRLKKQVLLSGITLVVSSFFLTSFYKISGKNDALNDDVKVMSYNVRMFNHTIWKKEKGVDHKIISFIYENNPDILCIQENMSLPEYKLKYPYNSIKKKYEKGMFGTAIYSKFKIINDGYLELGNTANEIIFADIVRKKDTIRVYNLHLQSLNISPEKENFGQENSDKLIEKLKERFKMQAEQTALFLAHEKKWKGKKIICGDFNNTAYSWVYNQISNDKQDAFLEAGKGFGKTFSYPFPMRIDFILVDNTATVHQFTTHTDYFSDHFAISSRINW